MNAAIAAWVLLAGILGFAAWFHRRQNEGTRNGTIVGGAISAPKSLWLAYALGAWFFCPLIFLLNGVSGAIQLVLLVHVGIWWLRGVLEHLMIHKWYNWSPIYGISHDLVHVVLLIWLGARALAEFQSAGHSWQSMEGWALIYVAATIFATFAEALFAKLFFTVRGGMKNHLIYFASDEPHFRTINRITTFVDVVVYAHLIAQAVGLSMLAAG